MAMGWMEWMGFIREGLYVPHRMQKQNKDFAFPRARIEIFTKAFFLAERWKGVGS